MASPDDKDDVDSKSPGFAMRLAISGICKKFPSVRNISTGTLASWQRRLPLATEDSPTSDDTRPVMASGNDGGDSVETPKRLIVLDSRPEEEFTVGKIPGSIRVDYESTPSDIVTSVPKLSEPDSQTTVVCYCSVGYRSSMVATKLQDFYQKSGVGSPKIFNLEGSIFQWANEGRMMQDGAGRSTKCTHPYNAVFGKLLNKELRKTSMDTVAIPTPTPRTDDSGSSGPNKL